MKNKNCKTTSSQYEKVMAKADILGTRLIDIINHLGFDNRYDAEWCLAITTSTLIMSSYKEIGINKSDAMALFKNVLNVMKIGAEEILKTFPDENTNTPLGTC